MPRRNDIKKVLILGSGPIIIGQACEFDYSGTQACKALREEGYEIVLVNSNPATIMTDPGMADRTYIEPLTVDSVARIIERERPDALLPNLGGQTGLNLASSLHKAGVLERYGVEVIGVKADAIERGEDRIAFKQTMAQLGVPVPQSAPCYSVEEAERIAEKLGYPVVLRPAYTLGGTGGGIAYNVEETEDYRGPRPGGQPDQPGPGGGVGLRLGGAGAGGRQGPEGPEDHGLLHRECGCHGRAHGRQLLRGAHAHRAPGAAGADAGNLLPDRGCHRGHRRHQYPVRPQPGG